MIGKWTKKKKKYSTAADPSLSIIPKWLSMKRDTPKLDREQAKIPVNGGLIMSYYKTKVAMWLPCGPAQQWPPNYCSRLHQTLCYSLSNSGMPAVVVCSTDLKKKRVLRYYRLAQVAKASNGRVKKLLERRMKQTKCYSQFFR